MSFTWPLVLLGLLAVPLAALLYVRAQRRSVRYAARFTNLDVLAAVVGRTPAWRRHLPAAALLAALAALVVGAAVWAWASHAQNHHHAVNGRRAAGVAALAALLIGAAPALINFFAEAGDQVK